MKKMVCGFSVVVALILVMNSSGFAYGWYAGVESGYLTHTFDVHYEYTFNDTSDDYTDRAYGVMTALIGGYKIPVAERLSLSVQGRVAYDSAEWTLHTDEPADLSYSMPFAYSAGLAPEIRVFDKISVFGELGIGQGYARMKKESLLDSRYNETKWPVGYSFGGGIRFLLSKKWQAFLQYRYVTYEKTCFDSHLPDGTRWEMIESETTTEVFSAGLIFNFGDDL